MFKGLLKVFAETGLIDAMIKATRRAKVIMEKEEQAAACMKRLDEMRAKEVFVQETPEYVAEYAAMNKKLDEIEEEMDRLREPEVFAGHEDQWRMRKALDYDDRIGIHPRPCGHAGACCTRHSRSGRGRALGPGVCPGGQPLSVAVRLGLG